MWAVGVAQWLKEPIDCRKALGQTLRIVACTWMVGGDTSRRDIDFGSVQSSEQSAVCQLSQQRTLSSPRFLAAAGCSVLVRHRSQAA